MRGSRSQRLVIVLGLGLLIYVALTFVLEVVRVSGPSMKTTLADGDVLLAARFMVPERGDIAVFHIDQDAGGAAVVKRVVAGPGDSLSIRQGMVRVNGHGLLEDYIPEIWRTGTTWGDGSAQVMGSDQYFMLGDNRDLSVDSRMFGPQPRRLVDGVAVFRLWPIWRVGPVLRDNRTT